MSLVRSKSVAERATRELSKPAAIIAVPHDLRAVILDVAAELIELNQWAAEFETRLSQLERGNNGKK